MIILQINNLLTMSKLKELNYIINNYEKITNNLK